MGTPGPEGIFGHNPRHQHRVCFKRGSGHVFGADAATGSSAPCPHTGPFCRCQHLPHVWVKEETGGTSLCPPPVRKWCFRGFFVVLPQNLQPSCVFFVSLLSSGDPAQQPLDPPGYGFRFLFRLGAGSGIVFLDPHRAHSGRLQNKRSTAPNEMFGP